MCFICWSSWYEQGSSCFIGVFGKLCKANRCFVLSVCTSKWNSSPPNGRIFMKFDTQVFLENQSDFNFYCDLTRIVCTVHGVCTFTAIYCWISVRMRNISGKSYWENPNTILCSVAFCWNSWCLWGYAENCGGATQARDDSITRHLPFSGRTTKVTNIHIEYVICIAFPLQQWLHERSSAYVVRTARWVYCNSTVSSLLCCCSVISVWRRMCLVCLLYFVHIFIVFYFIHLFYLLYLFLYILFLFIYFIFVYFILFLFYLLYLFLYILFLFILLFVSFLFILSYFIYLLYLFLYILFLFILLFILFLFILSYFYLFILFIVFILYILFFIFCCLFYCYLFYFYLFYLFYLFLYILFLFILCYLFLFILSYFYLFIIFIFYIFIFILFCWFYFIYFIYFYLFNLFFILFCFYFIYIYVYFLFICLFVYLPIYFISLHSNLYLLWPNVIIACSQQTNTHTHTHTRTTIYTDEQFVWCHRVVLY
jgi:hypothetical protein